MGSISTPLVPSFNTILCHCYYPLLPLPLLLHDQNLLLNLTKEDIRYQILCIYTFIMAKGLAKWVMHSKKFKSVYTMKIFNICSEDLIYKVLFPFIINLDYIRIKIFSFKREESLVSYLQQTWREFKCQPLKVKHNKRKLKEYKGKCRN